MKGILNEKLRKSKKSQVWIETVLYTLIGLAIIGVLLAATKPKINSTKDEFVIQQTITALNEFEGKISEIKQAGGNSRIVDFQLSRGQLTISPTSSDIVWSIKDSAFKLSEENIVVNVAGSIKGLTTKNGDNYNILLFLNYTGVNSLTVDNKKTDLVLQPAKTPYVIMVRNTGEVNATTNLLIVDISAS